MSNVYLILFLISTALHLTGTYKNDRVFRSATKGLILIFILGYYLESTDSRSWILIAALLTSWAGDMLLIPQGTKYFAMGGVSFMISHFLFMGEYASKTDFSKVPPAVAGLLGAVFAAAVCVIFSKLKKYLPKALVAPMFLYLLANGSMNCFAIFRLISCASAGSIVTALGALLFFISDTSLFFVRFNKDSAQKSHFLVMITYSLGEFLIVHGLLL